MKAIRGATTVERDSADCIKKAVKLMLNEIVKVNNLDKSQIICIMFSNTSDLRSFYPAKAAREAGFDACALYSSLEPEIDGALQYCIRVMILADTDDAPKHVYQGKAVNLRKDLTKVLNIALDGPAGSGKSTLAKALAKHYNILYLDTGAMYRAIALYCLQNGVDVSNAAEVERAIKNCNVEVEYSDGAQITKLNDKNVNSLIRTNEISMSASTVSAHKCTREKMVALQREIAKGISCVLDGRDIGTNVLPDAPFKFFITATAEVRAQRRYLESKAKGFNESYEEILKDIYRRDEQDKNRAFAPLRQADDAILVDTSDMNEIQVIEYIKNKIQEKI